MHQGHLSHCSQPSIPDTRIIEIGMRKVIIIDQTSMQTNKQINSLTCHQPETPAVPLTEKVSNLNPACFHRDAGGATGPAKNHLAQEILAVDENEIK